MILKEHILEEPKEFVKDTLQKLLELLDNPISKIEFIGDIENRLLLLSDPSVMMACRSEVDTLDTIFSIVKILWTRTIEEKESSKRSYIEGNEEFSWEDNPELAEANLVADKLLMIIGACSRSWSKEEIQAVDIPQVLSLTTRIVELREFYQDSKLIMRKLKSAKEGFNTFQEILIDNPSWL